MADLNKLLQDYVNLDYKDILALAKKNLAKVHHYFCSVMKDGNGAAAGLAFMGACLASDGHFNDLEYRLMNDLFGGGASYESLRNLAQTSFNQESLDLADAIYDNCPSDLRGSLLGLALCILAVDEHITKEETAFVHKLLN